MALRSSTRLASTRGSSARMGSPRSTLSPMTQRLGMWRGAPAASRRKRSTMQGQATTMESGPAALEAAPSWMAFVLLLGGMWCWVQSPSLPVRRDRTYIKQAFISMGGRRACQPLLASKSARVRRARSQRALVEQLALSQACARLAQACAFSRRAPAIHYCNFCIGQGRNGRMQVVASICSYRACGTGTALPPEAATT